MQCGIPASATASGGVYKFKDGRTVPDVLQISLEFPDQEFSMLYSATLANSMEKPKHILGTEAMLDINNSIEMYVDASSQKYMEDIDLGRINPEEPVYYTFIPGKKRSRYCFCSYRKILCPSRITLCMGGRKEI